MTDATTKDDQVRRDPYDGFEGTVRTTMAASTPAYPPRPRAPRGAPNVIVMLADDLGFSDLGCYGSEIATPELDALAARGLRYADFHATPLCSPTRASLLTGRNPHAAGVGIVTHVDPGFPGYESELASDQLSMAEVFRANGYSTLMVGKWHLCKAGDLNEAGDKSSWPLQRGFDQYYGFLEALTNYHHPHRLYEGNRALHTDAYPPGYYLTDDLTDQAEGMIRDVKAADPSKPFFLYYAHGAPHAPLHAKPSDLERQRGRYDEGWDVVRERRFARQVELGIVRQGTALPPRNHEPGEDVVAWDTLDQDQRRIYARYMECYAAMVETIDQSVGRLRQVLEELGEWDNTLIVFTSDNGASREGREHGTTAYFRDGGMVAERGSTVDPRDLENLDEIGGPRTWPHYPRGWAMACNTPFRLYKVNTHRGGHQVPLVLSWPARIHGAGQVVRRQFTHVVDLLPTLIDLAHLSRPDDRDGRPAAPIDGLSFAASVDDPEAPATRTEQYWECSGNRAYRRGAWEAVTRRQALTPFSEEHWELYDVEDDPTQTRDVADEHADVVADLQMAWDRAAWENGVYPLEEGARVSRLVRPPWESSLRQPVELTPANSTLERYRSIQLIEGRSFRVEVDWDYQTGDQGVIVAHGGQECGWLLYVLGDELVFGQNAHGHFRAMAGIPLPARCRQIALDVSAPGGRVWDVAIEVDGDIAAKQEGFLQLSGYLPFEGIDVGIDRRSPVSWDLYATHGPFPFTGEIHRVRFQPGQPSPDAADNHIEDARRLGAGLE